MIFFTHKKYMRWHVFFIQIGLHFTLALGYDIMFDILLHNLILLGHSVDIRSLISAFVCVQCYKEVACFVINSVPDADGNIPAWRHRWLGMTDSKIPSPETLLCVEYKFDKATDMVLLDIIFTTFGMK